MSEQTVLVPLSQCLGVGQRDKALPERDGGGTPVGTTSLKALAAKVLGRSAGQHRDNGGKFLSHFIEAGGTSF